MAFEKAFNAADYITAREHLEKLRTLSDKPEQVISPEVFALMTDEMRMMSFDRLLTLLARVTIHGIEHGDLPDMPTPKQMHSGKN